MTPEEREKELERIMRSHGCSAEEAEFIFAIEHGEIDGDVVELDEEPEDE